MELQEHKPFTSRVWIACSALILALFACSESGRLGGSENDEPRILLLLSYTSPLAGGDRIMDDFGQFRIANNSELGIRLINIYIQDDLPRMLSDAAHNGEDELEMGDLESLLVYPEVEKGVSWAKAIAAFHQSEQLGEIDFLTCEPSLILPNGSSPCTTAVKTSEAAHKTHRFECKGATCTMPNWMVSLSHAPDGSLTEVSISREGSTVSFIVPRQDYDLHSLQVTDFQFYRDEDPFAGIFNSGQLALRWFHGAHGENARAAVCAFEGASEWNTCDTYHPEVGLQRWHCGTSFCNEVKDDPTNNA